MAKTILVTGATDGIGLQVAKALASQGDNIILHGRNSAKLDAVKDKHPVFDGAEIFQADLSDLESVRNLATAIETRHSRLDVLINNAGVFKVAHPVTGDGFDVRFYVNTFAPYYLTKRLLPLMGKEGRVINLSSAAQAPVDLDALTGKTILPDSMAYAQSKLALTMWSRHMADNTKDGPAIIAVNPGSFLGTQMVKDAYGSEGKDIAIGVDIITRLATGPGYGDANGKYFDNDAGQFGTPHPDALNSEKNKTIVDVIEAVLSSLLGKKA